MDSHADFRSSNGIDALHALVRLVPDVVIHPVAQISSAAGQCLYQVDLAYDPFTTESSAVRNGTTSTRRCRLLVAEHVSSFPAVIFDALQPLQRDYAFTCVRVLFYVS